MNKIPIQFHKSREFGDFISDMFEVIKQNYKHLLRIFFIYGITPLFIGLVISFGLNMASFNIDSAYLVGFGGIGVLGLIVSYVVATTLVMGGSFSFLRGLAEGKTDIQAYDIMKDEVFSNAAKIFGFSLLLSLVMAPIGLVFYMLADMQSFGLVILFGIICFFAFIYIFVKFSLVTYIITIPGFSFGEAIRESMKLVQNRWWITFGLYVVVAIICTILAFILQIPGLIITMVGGLFAASSGAGESVILNSIIFSTFLSYAVGLLRVIVMAVFVALLYSSWHEMYYGNSIHAEISQLGKVREEDSFFENEGEL